MAACGRATTSPGWASTTVTPPARWPATPRDDVGIAAALLERRFDGPPPYDAATTRRAAGLLARRGFSEDAIAGLLRIDVSSA